MVGPAPTILDNYEKQQRHSLIALFRAMNCVPKRTIHVPEHYADLTGKIVGKLAIELETVRAKLQLSDEELETLYGGFTAYCGSPPMIVT